VITIKELEAWLWSARTHLTDEDEVRVDPHIDMTDQTPQEITAVESLTDEDGNAYLCLHMRNT
jgi:hypothetical protein